MSDLGFGAVAVCLSVAFMGLGVYITNDDIDDLAKKEDCEQSLILRAHECKLYYLTTEEIKLIERLGEKQ